MNDKLQLRPEDFRRAWANALAVCMNEATDILARLDEVHEKQLDFQNRLDFTDIEIRHAEGLLIKTSKDVNDSITLSVQEAVQRIELAGQQSQAELNASHLQFSRVAAQFIQNMESERLALIAEREAVNKSRNALEIEKSTTRWRRLIAVGISRIGRPVRIRASLDKVIRHAQASTRPKNQSDR